MLKVLVLCTGNSCRSILTEALFNHYGAGKIIAYSAGSNPTGEVHPLSIKTLQANNLNTQNLRSKSWDVFSDKVFDLVITVCDNAAGEACPIYLNSIPKAHWGVEDPAKFKGNEKEIENEFQRIFAILAKRTHAMVEKYNFAKKLELDELNQIGRLD